MIEGLTLHHVGLLTISLEATQRAYVEDFGATVEAGPIRIVSQAVTVLLLRLPDGSRLELVEPEPEASSLARLARGAQRFYHLGFEVADLDAAVAVLARRGYHPMKAFASELFGGKRCQFVSGPEGALLELIES